MTMKFRDWSVGTKLVLLLGVLLGALIGTGAFSWYALHSAGLRLEAALHPGTGAPFSPAGPALGGRVLLVAAS